MRLINIDLLGVQPFIDDEFFLDFLDFSLIRYHFGPSILHAEIAQYNSLTIFI